MSRRRILLLALPLLACTSVEPREPSKPIAQNPTPTQPEPKLPEPQQPEPPQPAADVKVAIASVMLEGDCPDPPGQAAANEAAAVPASIAPSAPKPVKRAPPGDEAPGAVSYRRACQQSTLQLSFHNRGSSEARVHLASVQLRDVKTDTVLAAVNSRLPSAWNGSSTYDAWNERVAAGTELSASYKLTPPDWSSVEGKLGGSSRERPLELEVVVEIDGKPTTVRSPSFMRAPELVMPPT